MDSTVIWKHFPRFETRPLILLHGIGMSSMVWLPVLPVLKWLLPERRVIAFDLPGFGKTPALLSGVDRTPRGIAELLVQVLRELKITDPVDVVGNSLGGYVALELAKMGHARSVVGISPAGLWHGTAPSWIEQQLRQIQSRVSNPFLLRVAKRLMHNPLSRARLLRIPVAAKGALISVEDAIDILDTFRNATDLEAVGQAASEQFRDGKTIPRHCKVTVAFGDKDLLLRKNESQYRDELPLHHVWSLGLHGCGHVAMYDNPKAVAKLIWEGTA